ncbi:MAG: sugar ABC transporter permease [Firmicutes bacterium]|nr:sugar ABC transporter permease [Bacillota bacterium]
MGERLRTANRRELGGYLFIFPAFLVMLMLVIYPLIYGGYISLFNTNLMARWNLVGLKYYLRILTDSVFWSKIRITISFTFWTVLGHFILGMVLALMLNVKIPGRAVFRAILLTPWLFPEVVVALVWKWLYNPMYGLINHFLVQLHVIAAPISWLGSPSAALPAVIIAAIWKGYPLIMVMLLAGLQAIPQELYEAAQIDGASPIQAFRYITLPGLRYVLVVSLILDTVWWFKHFTIIWVLTQGGPVDATNVISIDIYKTAFEYFRFGEAASMAVIVFFICFLFGYGYRRMLGDEGN